MHSYCSINAKESQRTITKTTRKTRTVVGKPISQAEPTSTRDTGKLIAVGIVGLLVIGAYVGYEKLSIKRRKPSKSIDVDAGSLLE